MPKKVVAIIIIPIAVRAKRDEEANAVCYERTPNVHVRRH